MTSRGGLERLQQYFICFGISNLLLSFLLVVNLEMKQIIVKEKGIFTNVTSPTTKAKLRLLFEVAPLGLLIENAGGHSSDGKQSVLDKVVTNTDDRTQVAYGSKNEIIRFEETLYGTSRLAAELASASA
jgi:sedoheptulose-bisphosphatase